MQNFPKTTAKSNKSFIVKRASEKASLCILLNSADRPSNNAKRTLKWYKYLFYGHICTYWYAKRIKRSPFTLGQRRLIPDTQVTLCTVLLFGHVHVFRVTFEAIYLSIPTQSHLKLQPQTLHLTVQLLDRYMMLSEVTLANIQLVGLASLLIATKYEERWPPSVSTSKLGMDRVPKHNV